MYCSPDSAHFHVFLSRIGLVSNYPPHIAPAPTQLNDFPLLRVNKFVHLFSCLVYYQFHAPNL